MVVHIIDEGGVAVVTIDNPPVNAASQAVREGLINALNQLEAKPAINAVVLHCAGRTFVAGADVREFGQPPTPPVLPDVVNALEGATKPWIAAIHGTALGGGLEIAMGCHYRIVNPATKLGLPEVNLGIIPGAGGTVRLPRLIPVDAALDMMATGKPISAQKAHAIGLIDQIATDNLRTEAIRYAREIVDQPFPIAVSERPLHPFDPDALLNMMDRVNARARGQNSPLAVCEAVQNVTTLSAQEALAAEREIFLRLKDDQQSLALRHIFFAERAAPKIERIKGIETPPLEQIGVVGGGTMGAGIAAACLLSGLSVTMIERDQCTLDASKDRVHKILDDSQGRGLIAEEARAGMTEAFNGSVSYVELAEASLVIEAVFEDMAVKQTVFEQLVEVVPSNAVLATNTSYLDINEIAQTLPDPSRVIGMHFFSPAHIMKLLELVIPDTASLEAIALGAALGKKLRKIVVPSGVCDGFIGNRIMSAYRFACECMIEDGALPQQIDQAMRAYGFPMGVFEVQDLSGLDIAWAMRKRRAATRDPSGRYVEIADKLCEQGRFGRKVGCGWYLYEQGKRMADPDVETLIIAESERKGINRRTFSDDEIMEEILSVMHREGTDLLAEGIASKANDIDVVMVNGYGFPRWRGGPMYLNRA